MEEAIRDILKGTNIPQSNDVLMSIITNRDSWIDLIRGFSSLTHPSEHQLLSNMILLKCRSLGDDLSEGQIISLINDVTNIIIQRNLVEAAVENMCVSLCNLYYRIPNGVDQLLSQGIANFESSSSIHSQFGAILLKHAPVELSRMPIPLSEIDTLRVAINNASVAIFASLCGTFQCSPSLILLGSIRSWLRVVSLKTALDICPNILTLLLSIGLTNEHCNIAVLCWESLETIFSSSIQDDSTEATLSYVAGVMSSFKPKMYEWIASSLNDQRYFAMISCIVTFLSTNLENCIANADHAFLFDILIEAISPQHIKTIPLTFDVWEMIVDIPVGSRMPYCRQEVFLRIISKIVVVLSTTVSLDDDQYDDYIELKTLENGLGDIIQECSESIGLDLIPLLRSYLSSLPTALPSMISALDSILLLILGSKRYVDSVIKSQAAGALDLLTLFGDILQFLQLNPTFLEAKDLANSISQFLGMLIQYCTLPFSNVLKIQLPFMIKLVLSHIIQFPDHGFENTLLRLAMISKDIPEFQDSAVFRELILLPIYSMLVQFKTLPLSNSTVATVTKAFFVFHRTNLDAPILSSFFDKMIEIGNSVLNDPFSDVVIIRMLTLLNQALESYDVKASWNILNSNSIHAIYKIIFSFYYRYSSSNILIQNDCFKCFMSIMEAFPGSWGIEASQEILGHVCSMIQHPKTSLSPIACKYLVSVFDACSSISSSLHESCLSNAIMTFQCILKYIENCNSPQVDLDVIVSVETMAFALFTRHPDVFDKCHAEMPLIRLFVREKGTIEVRQEALRMLVAMLALNPLDVCYDNTMIAIAHHVHELFGLCLTNILVDSDFSVLLSMSIESLFLLIRLTKKMETVDVFQTLMYWFSTLFPSLNCSRQLSGLLIQMAIDKGVMRMFRSCCYDLIKVCHHELDVSCFDDYLYGEFL